MKITKKELNDALVESIIAELNERHLLDEGTGWDSFKASARRGFNAIADEDDSDEESDMTFKKFVNGRPNKIKSDYHKIMAKNATDPKAKERHSMQATMTEPGLSGKAKRAGMAAGFTGGVVAKGIANGAKSASKKMTKPIRDRKAFNNDVDMRADALKNGDSLYPFYMDDKYDAKVQRKAEKKLGKRK